MNQNLYSEQLHTECSIESTAACPNNVVTMASEEMEHSPTRNQTYQTIQSRD